MSKRIYVKTYDASGNYKAFYDNFNFASPRSAVNSGPADLALSLPNKFDDFSENVNIGINYRLDVLVYDSTTPTGTKMYSGRLERYTPSVSDNESVNVLCIGEASRLSLDFYQASGSVLNTILTGTPGTLIKGIIDTYRTNNSDTSITYTTTSIDTSGSSVTIEADSSTYQELINQCTEEAGATWFWYIDTSNTLYFKQFATTPTHYFMFKRDIAAISYSKDMTQTRNGQLFWNGLQKEDPEYISKLYTNTTSVATYGRRMERKRDGRFKRTNIASGADLQASRFLTSYKDPINTISLTIISDEYYQGYRIENINVGDTCKILNLPGTTTLPANNIITSIQYNLDSVNLEIADFNAYISRRIFELENQARNAAYADSGPLTYDLT